MRESLFRMNIHALVATVDNSSSRAFKLPNWKKANIQSGKCKTFKTTSGPVEKYKLQSELPGTLAYIKLRITQQTYIL